MILVVDNFDSFVHNLARYLRQLGQESVVMRNDDRRLLNLETIQPEAILISPGPKTPVQNGFCIELIRAYHETIPLIGVCLGHQAIVEALGGRIIRADEPMHGRTSMIQHFQHPMFDQISSPVQVCRYHSLVADKSHFPNELEVTATSDDDNAIMAFAHKTMPIFGIQFHPESVLTDSGYQLLKNVLELCGIRCDGLNPDELQACIRLMDAAQ